MVERLQSRGFTTTTNTELQISTMKLILLVVLTTKIWSDCWDAVARGQKVFLYMNTCQTRVLTVSSLVSTRILNRALNSDQ